MTDTEDNEEEDLGVMDDQRSVILHLISQLKLGMDLTRVGTLYLFYKCSLSFFLLILSCVCACMHLIPVSTFFPCGQGSLPFY